MQQDGKTILGFIPDLFFSIKVRDTAHQLGYSVQISRTIDDLVQKAREISPSLVIVDLTEDVNLKEPLMRIKDETQSSPIPLLAFTTHAAWKQTAPLHSLCNQVVTKEIFSRDLPVLLRRYLGGETN